MKVSLIDLRGQSVGEIDVAEEIFGVPVRADILSRVVLWQLAKRRSGSHQTKGVSQVSGTTRKPHKQKGTGRARQGSLRSPQFRGGGIIFGPLVRDHGYSLPKKVRRLGLKCALSDRLSSKSLFVIDDMSLSSPKTKEIATAFSSGSVLMIGGGELCPNLRKAVSNISQVNLLPCQGINVYDVIRHDRLMLSREALEYLQEFLSN